MKCMAILGSLSFFLSGSRRSIYQYVVVWLILVMNHNITSHKRMMTNLAGARFFISKSSRFVAG